MAVATNYRLPGVYSTETTGPFVSAVAGGNAVPVFVGPAVGYYSGTQQSVFTAPASGNPAAESIGIENAGVLSGSVSVRNRVYSRDYEEGVDFEVVEDAETGLSSVVRKINRLSITGTTVTGFEHVYSVAEPEFSLFTSGQNGYIVAGTLSITDESAEPNPVELVEGTDFTVYYHKGTVKAINGGALDDANGHELSADFVWCSAEPVEFVGESAVNLVHKYIAANALGSDGNYYTVKMTPATYTDPDTETQHTFGEDTDYEEGVDFVIDYLTGTISKTSDSRIPEFDPELKNYMYVEFGYSGIHSGESVLVTYDYRSTDYTSPRTVASYSEAVRYYGEAWDSDGNVQSPLSLAAYIAFQNAMPYCWTVATDESLEPGGAGSISASSWTNAFGALETVSGIDIVVPIPGNAEETYLAPARTHIANMKVNQDERVLIIGKDGTGSVVPPASMISFAKGIGDADVWVVAPSTFRLRNPVRGTVDIVAGFYAAAAVAGYNSSVAQYIPLTRKVVNGFYSANEYGTKVDKTNESAGGLMYIDEINGQLRILHGRTTSSSGALNMETNIILTKYFIIKRIRQMFEDGYIGNTINGTTLMSIKSSAQSILMNLRDSGYMYEFSDLVVAIDEFVPTQVNISFSYIPTYGLNYIDISFSLDASIQSIVI